jgi:hypothetical protein
MPNAALAAYSMIRKAIIDFILNKTSGRGFRQEGEIPVVDSHVACSSSEEHLLPLSSGRGGPQWRMALVVSLLGPKALTRGQGDRLT